MADGMEHGAAYPPLDVPKPVADRVWIVDGPPLRMLAMPLPVRMSVIRLTNGDLLLHSPTHYTEALRQVLDGLGRIRHLVAPNSVHWTFLKAWQEHCPDATTWAAPGLRQRRQVRKSGVRLDRDLPDTAPPEWADEIEQAVVPGGGGFREVAFFHKPSRTLLLTDLVLNIEPSKMPALMRPVLRAIGVAAPNGRAPVYLRMVIRLRRRDAALAASRILAWHPERVVFTHGRWFAEDATAALRRSLSWLVK